jgi:hypothetical protein
MLEKVHFVTRVMSCPPAAQKTLWGRLIGVYLRIFLRVLVDNGFLQLKKRVVGELQPTVIQEKKKARHISLKKKRDRLWLVRARRISRCIRSRVIVVCKRSLDSLKLPRDETELEELLYNELDDLTLAELISLWDPLRSDVKGYQSCRYQDLHGYLWFYDHSCRDC